MIILVMQTMQMVLNVLGLLSIVYWLYPCGVFFTLYLFQNIVIYCDDVSE